MLAMIKHQSTVSSTATGVLRLVLEVHFITVHYIYKQVAQLSQRYRTMLRVIG